MTESDSPRLSEAVKVAAVLGVGVLGIDELLDGTGK
jgi:hypothetical protein